MYDVVDQRPDGDSFELEFLSESNGADARHLTVATWLITAWTNLLAEESLMRAQHLGAAGTLIRKKRVPLHRAATADVITILCPDVDGDVRADVVDAALVLTSSTALFEFIDVLELSVERAARLAARAVASLITAANADSVPKARGGPERVRQGRAQ